MPAVVISTQRGGAVGSGQHQVDVGVGVVWQVERNRPLEDVQDVGVGEPCGALQCEGAVFLPDPPLGQSTVQEVEGVCVLVHGGL